MALKLNGSIVAHILKKSWLYTDILTEKRLPAAMQCGN